MKLVDLIRKGSLIGSKCSKVATVAVAKPPSVGSTLFKNNLKVAIVATVATHAPSNGEDRTGTPNPVATATPATPATEERPLPYLDADGSLVMPFSADPRYHYWRGGQSLVTTEEELKSWKH